MREPYRVAWAFIGAVAISALAPVIAGCGSKGSAGSNESAGSTGAAEPAPSADAAPAATVEVGDVIVAATSKFSFVQGKVVAVTADKVTYEYGRTNRETNERPQKTISGGDAYLVGASVDLAAGDHLACRVAERSTSTVPLATWHPCRVLAVSGPSVKVEDHYGTKYDLEPRRVVKPSEDTRKAIAAYIDQELRHREFDVAFEKSGHPFHPPGWKPTVDAAVVIHWVGTSWYGGKVVAVKPDKGKVRVGFEGKRWGDRDVAKTEVAPMPGEAAAVAVDQFALARPAAADERWEHVRVVSRDGDDVEVVNRSGIKRKLSRRDLVPVVKPRADETAD